MPLMLRDIRYISAFYFLMILSFYSTVFTSSYAFLDDYGTVAGGIENLPFSLKLDIYSGRPIFALFRLFESCVVNNIHDLWLLRALSVTTLFLLTTFIYRFISERNIFDNEFSRISFPLALAFLPSLQVFSSWATCYSFTFAVLLCGYAYSLLTSYLKKNNKLKLIASAILIASSFAIYQPSGMAFMAFLLIDNCLVKREIKIKNLLAGLLMMFTGMLSSLIMTKLLPKIIYGNSISRSAMTSDFSGKISWFFNETLYNTFNTYKINPNWTFFLTGLVLFCVAALYIIKTKSGIIKFSLLILAPVLSYFPNLYISESWAAQRSMIAISLCVSSIIIFGALKLSDSVSGFVKSDSYHFSWLFPLILVLSTGIAASYNINNFMVLNQIQERESVAYAIADKVDKSFTGEVMVDVRERNWGAFSKVVRYDEFGENSIYAPWAIRGVLLSIKKDKGYAFQIPKDPAISEDNQCGPNCVVINPGKAMINATTNY